jgi:hypothetical protein
MLSCSFITHQLNPTWADSGLVVLIPQENLYLATFGDAGLPNLGRANLPPEKARKELTERAQSVGLLTPHKLIAMQRAWSDFEFKGQTAWGINELGVAGEAENGSRVSASAYFLKLDSHGKPRSSAHRVAELERLSQRFGLPLLRIYDTNPDGALAQLT